MKTLSEKLAEALENATPRAMRLYLLMHAVAVGEADNEILAAILDIEVEDVVRTKAEIRDAITEWNKKDKSGKN